MNTLLAGTRLLTLTGVGGCGKTRLALRLAHDLASTYRYGAAWVDLAGLTDPALIPQAVARALHVREKPGQSWTETLARFVTSKHLLLVLDNCEHVRGACATLAEALLPAAPHLQILATSREPLALAGETTWLVPSLSLPDAEQPLSASNLADYDAPALFVQRAQAVLPGFRATGENVMAIVQLCQRLDGIPLAIELAAARITVLSVAEIAARLDDRFSLLTVGNRTALIPRHQTLRAAIDWSYALLAEPERVLFRRLAVFAGGFTLEAAETVCADEVGASHPERSRAQSKDSPLPRSDILDLLTQLVNKSLVVAQTQRGSPARYQLLETMRAYARERLRDADEETLLRRRHLGWLLRVARQSSAEQRTALDAEANNMREVLQWGAQAAPADAAMALELALSLAPRWTERGYWAEARRWVESLLEPAAGAASTLTRAGALQVAGDCAIALRDYSAARTRLERSLILFSELDDQNALAQILTSFGVIEVSQGRMEAALAYYEQGLARFRQLDDAAGIANTLIVMGALSYTRSSYDKSDALFRESLNIFRRLGDRLAMARCLNNWGDAARYYGDYTRAAQLYQSALECGQSFGPHFGVGTIRFNQCLLALEQGQTHEAAALLDASLQASSERKPGPEVHYALASIALLDGQLEVSARLFGAAAACAANYPEIITPADQLEFERQLARLRAQMNPHMLERAWQAGQLLPFDEALDEGRSLLKRVLNRPAASHDSFALRLFALGPAQVWRGERLLNAADWVYAKPKELLFYLLLHAASTREQIGAALWPDASAAHVHHNLRMALYHLRRALGRSDWIVFQHDQYAFNRSRSCWFDVEAFEQESAQGRQAVANNQAALATGHLQSAIQLYRGDLLDELADSEWLTLRREELRRILLDDLMALGQLHVAAGVYAQAAEVYRQALARDPYREDAHRALLACYARQGERALALQHYASLLTLLRDELGIAPAPETTALITRLQHGDAE